MIIKRPLGEKGQVVIPKDIREILGLRRGSEVIFEVANDEVKIKSEQDPKEFLKSFLNVPKPKKNLTLKEIRKIEDESYDLP